LIGPTTGLEPLRETDGKSQFAVTIKNFGEIPVTNVIAHSDLARQIPKKENLTHNDSKTLNDFVLGPLLPNMEKR
jgi:hypothetical protein